MAIIDKYTTSLCHFDKDFSDNTGISWSSFGNPQIKQGAGRFGNGLYLDGNSRLYTPGTAFQLGNKFTIDMWINPEVVDSRIIMGNWNQSASLDDWAVYIYSGSLRLVLGSIETDVVVANGLIANAIQHIAISRDTNDWYAFIGGKLLGHQVSTAQIRNVATTNIGIGGENVRTDTRYKGVIDEPRVSSITRWTADFDPSNIPYEYYDALDYIDKDNNLYGYK